MSAAFFRLIEAKDKAEVLRSIIRFESKHLRFDVDTSSFADIPRSPFAYWATESLVGAFRDFVPLSDVGVATVGLQSSDDFRFVAAWWEKEPGGGFLPFAKGGRFSPHYSDVHLIVTWAEDGHEIKAFAEMTPGSKHWSRNIRSAEHYRRPGITWSRRTNRLSFRAMPAGCVFADKGPAIFTDADDQQALLALLAIVNSRIFGALVALQVAGTELAQSFEVGLIQQTPIPSLSPIVRQKLAGLAKEAWSQKRRIDTNSETSHVFVLPELLQVDGGTLKERVLAYFQYLKNASKSLDSVDTRVADHCFGLYQISQKEQHLVEHGFAGANNMDVAHGEDQKQALSQTQGDGVALISSLLSWGVGAAFGRFDVRLATGAKSIPSEPEPFDSLPSCSPGMLAGGDGLPFLLAPADYPLVFPADGTFVDDQGHAADLVSHSLAVIEEVFDQPEARWHEAAELVGARNQDLRTWFAKNFFDYHIKQYSKSRRKAPIYWQLATPSASYSAWTYYHRLTRDTFFRVANDYVTPKVGHEERKLNALRQEAGSDPSSKQRKVIDAQEAFVAELRAFRAEVARIAPLWNPNLNDGVIINFAPLWRLVPQHKSWQKECKKVWDKLVKGDYDWAHLAMHLWPERVVPKCKDDRSLAIAHGLEDEFWFEDDDGKKTQWKKRQVNSDRVTELVAERSSTAVKAALQDLLEAPAPAGQTRRKRRARA
jgi:hypothetical protein